MESSSQVVKILNEVEEVKQPKDEYTLSNGVVLGLKLVNNLLILDATKKIPIPAVPVVFIEEKGRSEENPSDPQYLEQMQEYQQNRALLTSSLMVAYGTFVKSLPEEYSPYDDNTWATDLEEFGIKVPIKGKARYSVYVRYHLIPNDRDMGELLRAIMRYSGATMEEDVATATDSFRGDTPRNSS